MLCETVMATRPHPIGSPAKPAAYDLWFDESGQFTETSTRPWEHQKPQSFPSQLAGILVPRGALTSSVAETMLAEAHRAARLPFGDEVHGMQIDQDRYVSLVHNLLEQIRARGWQPVRLVNAEGVRYGDRSTTYTQMVAELVLRVLRELARQGEPQVELHLWGAIVVLGRDGRDQPIFLQEEEYNERIQKALAFVAVRRGLAADLAGWKVASMRTASGKKRRELQVCDLLSNSSHAGFKRLPADTERLFRDILGAYDQTLVLRELFEKVDDFLAAGALGRALMLLAESGIDPTQVHDEAFRRRVTRAVGRLSGLGARSRDPELATLVTWIEQVIEHHRALKEGRLLASFLLQQVEAPLRALLEATGRASELDWFCYALHRWTLTADNHLGDLVGGRVTVGKLDALTPSLAQRWEHVPLLMQGLIAQAVHRTDCFAYDDASARMKVVSGYYGELSGLFSTLMPEVFPETIRSNPRAEALGTWAQTETYAALREPKRLVTARDISEDAIAEFSSDDDRARQWQYRSHLETIAGDFAEARKYLAKSLGLQVYTHDAIGGAIAALREPRLQGFPLLHWLRLGRAGAMLAGEREEFFAALKVHKTFSSPWLTGGFDDYPVHGILRQAAVIHALQGLVSEVMGSLTHLRRASSGLVLSTIVLSATVEVAGLLWAKHRPGALALLDGKDKDKPGALQQLQALSHAAKEGVPELWVVFEPWEGVIRSVLGGNLAGRDPKDVLLGLTRVVPY